MHWSFGKYWFTELCRSSKCWYDITVTKQAISPEGEIRRDRPWMSLKWEAEPWAILRHKDPEKRCWSTGFVINKMVGEHLKNANKKYYINMTYSIFKLTYQEPAMDGMCNFLKRFFEIFFSWSTQKCRRLWLWQCLGAYEFTVMQCRRPLLRGSGQRVLPWSYSSGGRKPS